jgi:hypothetical protein
MVHCDLLRAKFVAYQQENYRRECLRLFYRCRNADFVEQSSVI